MPWRIVEKDGDRVISRVAYDEPKIYRLAGQYLALCARGRGTCVRVKMPKSLGKVERVVAGPLLERSRASWIALSKFESFVCAVLENSTKVVCARILGEAFPYDQAELRVQLTATGKAKIKIGQKNRTVDEKRLLPYAKIFLSAYRTTKFILQGEIDAASSQSYKFASTLNICDGGNPPADPGPQPHPGCELADDGNGGQFWVCVIIGDLPDPTPDPEDPDPGDPSFPCR